MTVGVWKTMALTAALLVWGADSHAQTTTGSLPAVRPAPVTGRVAPDPAAVALRPAAQGPATSTARQVPAPANLNEPLLPTEAAPVKVSDSPRRVERRTGEGELQQGSPRHGVQGAAKQQEVTPPVVAPTHPHVDRTHGVKKTSETRPRPHERKVKGKPHHAGQGASSVEPKDDRRKGSKRGSQQLGHSAGAAAPAASSAHTVTATGRRHAHGVKKGSPAHEQAVRAGSLKRHTAQHASRQGAPLAKATTHHAHAAAPKASAPVAKKPVRRVHPSV